MHLSTRSAIAILTAGAVIAGVLAVTPAVYGQGLAYAQLRSESPTGRDRGSSRAGTISVSLETDKLAVNPGEAVTFMAATDSDCYLTVVHLAKSGRVTVLWPNQTTNWDGRISGGRKAVQVPGDAAGVRLQFDGSSPEERIIAVAVDEKDGIFRNSELRLLPGSQFKEFVGDSQKLMDRVRSRLKALGESYDWGMAELTIQVASGSEPTSRVAAGPEERRRPDGPMTVTLHIFSGRPDPTWTLDRSQALLLSSKAAKLEKKLVPRGEETAPPTMGYRGFTIEGLQTPEVRGKGHLFAKRLDVEGGPVLDVDSDTDLEHWLLDTAGEALDPETRAYALGLMVASQAVSATPPTGRDAEPSAARATREPDAYAVVPEDEAEAVEILEKFEAELDKGEPGAFAPKARVQLITRSPQFEPRQWNQPGVVLRNNCYNYGTNRMTHSYAQPGRYCRRPIPGRVTRAKVIRAAKCDGLVPVRWNPRRARGETIQEGKSAQLEPKGRRIYGHVAMVCISPGHDYHWYRLDNTGRWSHKSGKSRATDRDGRGRLITDPRRVAAYPQFGSFFFVPTYTRVKEEMGEGSADRARKP